MTSVFRAGPPGGAADTAGNVNGSPGRGWAGQIYTYTKSTGVYLCPDDPSATTGDSGLSPNTGTAYVVSYLYNENLAASLTDPIATNPGGAISGLVAPASTVLLFEGQGMVAELTTASEYDSSVGNGHDCDGTNSAGKFRPQGAASGPNNVRKFSGALGNRPDELLATGASSVTALQVPLNPAVHTGGMNFLACDGHVKWLFGSKVSSGATPTGSGCVQSLSATANYQSTAACVQTNPASGYKADDNSASSDQLASDPSGPFQMTFSPF